MIWTTLVGPTLLAAAILLLPGLLITLAAGLRGFAALAYAPALSVTAVSVGALAGGLAGVRWSWWLPALAALVMAAAAWLIAHLLGRRFEVPPEETAKGARGLRESLRAEAPLWAGLAVAGVLLARHFRNILDRPDAFSQTFDNVFHLSAIRYIVTTGKGSPLELMQMISPGQPPSFYPNAFHDTAALVMHTYPATVTIPTNAVLLVTVVLVWPLSCLALVRSILPSSWPVLVGTGVLAASFSAFPILLLDFGVLYPNLFGLALLPAALGLLVQGLGLGLGRGLGSALPPWLAWCLLAASAPGLLVAHPNTFMTLVAISVPLVLAVAWRQVTGFASGAVKPARLAATLAGVLVFLGIALVLWRAVRPDEAAATWPPIATIPSALGQAILNAPDRSRAAWLVSILMVVGLASARRARLAWLALAWLVIVGLWLVVAGAGPSRTRTFLTGIWYNDPWRFAAMLPVVALPLAAVGLSVVAQWLNDALRSPAARLRGGAAAVTTLVTLVTTLLLVAGTQWASYMNVAVDKASSLYALTADSPLVSADEAAVLKRAAEIVPPDAVIATNPWNGSSMAWALEGLRTTTTHIFYTSSPDLDTINNTLDEADARPATCAAINRLDVHYVLDFGKREVHGGDHPYPGFDSLASARGFREVARQGSAALYEVTACR